MSETLQPNRVGVFHYVLKNNEGAIVDQSYDAPMAFLCGHNNIVPGLEKALIGKTAGDSLDVVVPAAEGYGAGSGIPPEAIKRSEFPRDMQLFKGMPMQAEDSDGNPVILYITEIRGSRVYVTADHPLAGQDLHFHIAMVKVRDATSSELSHGHAHGPDGQTLH